MMPPVFLSNTSTILLLSKKAPSQGYIYYLRFSLSMKILKTNLLFSQFKFLDCPKQGKGKAILVIFKSEKIDTKIIYSKRLDKTVHEPAVYFC